MQASVQGVKPAPLQPAQHRTSHTNYTYFRKTMLYAAVYDNVVGKTLCWL